MHVGIKDKTGGLKMNNIELPQNVKKASKETIEFLLKVGILYKDETGIHVKEQNENIHANDR